MSIGDEAPIFKASNLLFIVWLPLNDGGRPSNVTVLESQLSIFAPHSSEEEERDVEMHGWEYLRIFSPFFPFCLLFIVFLFHPSSL